MKKYLMVLLHLLMAYSTTAQQATVLIDVNGLLLDEHNMPVVASILVKDSRLGTSSNEKGRFELKQVNATATLVITGIGFNSTEVQIKGRSNLGIIILKGSIIKGEEVVVTANTGYQTLKPNEINGSVVVVDSKQLNLQTGTNILKRLDGIVPGLLFNIGKTNDNPQNNTGISIRGLGTINGPLDPLIVLDGFIYEGNIENINPNDVENITILKDAAAASVWGARAGNGVIVITTRKGGMNQKMQVTASSGFIITDRPDLQSVPQMNTADMIDLETFLFGRGYFNARINSSPYLALTPAVKILNARRRGLISAADSATQLNALKQNDSRSEYERLAYRAAVTQQHAVGVRGGSNKNAYTFSAAYDHTTGNLREEYKKLNLRVANSYQLHQRIRLNMETYYTNSSAISGQTAYGNLRPAERSMLYHSLLNKDGSPAGIDLKYNTDVTDTLLRGRLLDHRYYVLEDYKHNRTRSDLQELNANLGLNTIITNWLNLDVKYQYQLQHTGAEKLADRNSFEARDLINSLTQVDPLTGVLKYIVPLGGIRTLSNSRIGSQTFRAQLNVDKSFGAHQVDAIVGTESREQQTTGDSYTTFGYNADPLMTTVVDMTNTYPDPITGFRTGPPGRPAATNREYRFTAAYINAAWLWKQKYSLTASGRRDGSNIFGATTNDRWKPLWSAGAGWNLSKESFLKSRLLNDLRFKISYGHSGNVDLSKTAVPIAIVVGNDVNTNLPFSRITQLNNPTLRWEQVRQINAGAVFAALNNRLTGSVEWYSKKGTDLYGPIEWDYTGFGNSNTVTQNVANTDGKGFDIMLNNKNIVGKFEWVTGILFSYNKTVIDRYFGPLANGFHNLIGGGSKIIPVKGKDVYGVMAYRWGGLDAAGNPQGYVNGALSTDYFAMSQEAGSASNLVYFGSGTPRYFGALSNAFTYRNVTLSFNMVAKLNYAFFKPALMYSSIIAGGSGTSDYVNRWQQPGDERLTDVPSFQYPNNNDRDYFYSGSSVHVLKGSHLRLQYVNLVYRTAFKKIPALRDIQFYANAANLGILWRANKKHIDPDYPRGGAPTKTWSFGVRANF